MVVLLSIEPSEAAAQKPHLGSVQIKSIFPGHDFAMWRTRHR